jgi:hypothetical protein
MDAGKGPRREDKHEEAAMTDAVISPKKPLLSLKALPAQAAVRVQRLAWVLAAPRSGLAQAVHHNWGWRFPLGLLAVGSLALAAAAAWAAPEYLPYLTAGLVRVGLAWAGWLWVSGAIRSMFILAGVRSTDTSLRTVVAWAAAPLFLRELVRTGYVLVAGAPAACPGLSGLFCQGEAGWELLAGAALAQVDVYLVWHAILLWIGLPALFSPTASRRRKALLVAVTLALGSALALKGLAGALWLFLNAPAAELVL